LIGHYFRTITLGLQAACEDFHLDLLRACVGARGLVVGVDS